jgi:succinoglycan biosynthesis protein ExoM
MYQIAVCIPTYKRPDILRLLLDSISKNNFDKSLIQSIDVVVVDNDADRTAEVVINDLKRDINLPYQLQYYNYTIKGLSHVRNELLRRGLSLNPDFLIFIDDDEYVTTEWMNELLRTIIHNNADAARGPVFVKISGHIPQDISKLFVRENYPNNTRLSKWATGNLILRRTSLEKYNVWFDERFSKSGSEDFYFGIQMAKKGASIFWAAHAVTYEIIPDARANVQWLIKRKYRSASTFMYIMVLEKSYLKIIKKIGVSFAYIIAGIPALLMLLSPIKKNYWGIMKLYEGVGGLAGLFDIQYREYK